MQAKLKEIKEELRQRRHQPIPEQGEWLRQVEGGFFAYHAVLTNSHALTSNQTVSGHERLGRSQRGGMNIRANTFGSPEGEPSTTRSLLQQMCEKSLDTTRAVVPQHLGLQPRGTTAYSPANPLSSDSHELGAELIPRG